MDNPEELELIQREIETFCLGVSLRLLRMQRGVRHCRGYCTGQDELGLFESVFWADVCRLFPPDIEPLKRPVVAIGGRFLEPGSKLIVGASDGSVVKGYGMRVGACGWYFYPSCAFNGSACVMDSSSTLVTEVSGIFHLLDAAEEAKIVELLVCVDNLCASQFVSALCSGDVLSSRTLQNYIGGNPALGSLAEQLKPKLRRLKTLILVWQKSHVEDRGLFCSMNRSADELAVGRARQLLEEATK
jgi:hypothetical protein